MKRYIKLAVIFLCLLGLFACKKKPKTTSKTDTTITTTNANEDTIKNINISLMVSGEIIKTFELKSNKGEDFVYAKDIILPKMDVQDNEEFLGWTTNGTDLFDVNTTKVYENIILFPLIKYKSETYYATYNFYDLNNNTLFESKTFKKNHITDSEEELHSNFFENIKNGYLPDQKSIFLGDRKILVSWLLDKSDETLNTDLFNEAFYDKTKSSTINLYAKIVDEPKFTFTINDDTDYTITDAKASEYGFNKKEVIEYENKNNILSFYIDDWESEKEEIISSYTSFATNNNLNFDYDLDKIISDKLNTQKKKSYKDLELENTITINFRDNKLSLTLNSFVENEQVINPNNAVTLTLSSFNNSFGSIIPNDLKLEYKIDENYLDADGELSFKKYILNDNELENLSNISLNDLANKTLKFKYSYTPSLYINNEKSYFEFPSYYGSFIKSDVDKWSIFFNLDGKMATSLFDSNNKKIYLTNSKCLINALTFANGNKNSYTTFDSSNNYIELELRKIDGKYYLVGELEKYAFETYFINSNNKNSLPFIYIEDLDNKRNYGIVQDGSICYLDNTIDFLNQKTIKIFNTNFDYKFAYPSIDLDLSTFENKGIILTEKNINDDFQKYYSFKDRIIVKDIDSSFKSNYFPDIKVYNDNVELLNNTYTRYTYATPYTSFAIVKNIYFYSNNSSNDIVIDDATYGLFGGKYSLIGNIDFDYKKIYLNYEITTNNSLMFDLVKGDFVNGSIYSNGKILLKENRENVIFANTIYSNSTLENIKFYTTLGFDLSNENHLTSINYVVGKSMINVSYNQAEFNLSYSFNLTENSKNTRINFYKETNNYGLFKEFQAFFDTDNFIPIDTDLNYKLVINLINVYTSDYLKSTKNLLINLTDFNKENEADCSSDGSRYRVFESPNANDTEYNILANPDYMKVNDYNFYLCNYGYYTPVINMFTYSEFSSNESCSNINLNIIDYENIKENLNITYETYYGLNKIIVENSLGTIEVYPTYKVDNSYYSNNPSSVYEEINNKIEELSL